MLIKPNICPECIQGKHVNCTGEALNEEMDIIVSCSCGMNHG